MEESLADGTLEFWFSLTSVSDLYLKTLQADEMRVEKCGRCAEHSCRTLNLQLCVAKQIVGVTKKLLLKSSASFSCNIPSVKGTEAGNQLGIHL